MYQLRSPESSDTSVCLFTDFDSQVQLTQITGSKWNMMHKTNSTALDMEILGSKSNGIVTWGNTSDAGCEDTFSKDILVAPSDGECSLGSALSCLLHRQAHLCPGLRCVTSKSRSDWWFQPHQLSAKTPPFSFLSIREPHPGRSQNILDKEQRGKNVRAPGP